MDLFSPSELLWACAFVIAFLLVSRFQLTEHLAWLIGLAFLGKQGFAVVQELKIYWVLSADAQNPGDLRAAGWSLRQALITLAATAVAVAVMLFGRRLMRRKLTDQSP